LDHLDGQTKQVHIHVMSDEQARQCREVASTCALLRVRQASRVITQRYDQALATLGVRATQFNVLVAAGASDGRASIGHLAGLLVMDRTTLTRALAGLEQEHLVTVGAAADDARRKVVRLSARGRQVLEKGLPLWQEAQRQLQAELGSRSWDDLHARLRQVVALGSED
jgi:DNA-binding MarR family transcriptional regulator